MKINKRKDSFILYGVGICFICLLLVGFFGKKHFDISEYITINYSGADNYATAHCTIDKEKMYMDIAGKEKDEHKLELYKELVNSISANVESTDISNGDKFEVLISCNESAAKSANIKINNSYTVRASGISEGEKINLFDNIEVVFTGISPDAYVVINNNWEDEYLGGLTFTASKDKNIITGDEITLKCDDDMAQLARNGFITDTDTMIYKADKLSSYIENVAQLDKDIIKNIDKQNMDLIVSETSDKTFRMLYKATGNKDYLYSLNDETAQNIELLGNFFLKTKQTQTEQTDNYLIWIYGADISNSDTTEKVYFLFEYSKGFLSVDGVFNIAADNAQDRYVCSTDYEEIYGKYISDRENDYAVMDLNE